MKKITIILVVLLVAGTHAWAQSQFASVSGKVEVRPASGGSWTVAEVGMELDRNTVISTGFNASAEVQMGASTVTIEQLTRLEFQEIVERSNSVETDLRLKVGSVRAQVRSVDQRSQDFRVSSPISTAAVRGTDFVYSGRELSVQEGDVAFSNLIGQQHSVRAGQTSRTWKHAPFETVEATIADDLQL